MVNAVIPIARPPWSHLGKNLESMCRKALYEFSLIEEGTQKIAVALSGGKDSLTLLFLLKAIVGRGFPDAEIIAVHVTGEFSCGAGVELAFLKGICRDLGVALHVTEVGQSREGLQCYSCSRKRRSALFELAKRNGAETIAFGHHKDDNVQTLLMNMLHKAEPAAMLPKIPMWDYGVTIIRPLVYISEETIIAFARMYDFARITCRCPVGQNSLRSKTKKLLRDLEALYPNARENLSKVALEYGSKKALYAD